MAATAPAGKLSGATSSVNQTVLGSFKGQINPVRIQGNYILGLIGAAFVMILLPLIYISMVGGVAYLTYEWYQGATQMMSESGSSGGYRRSRGAGTALLFVIAPVIVGIVLVIFMIRPLFYFFTLGGSEQRRKIAKNTDPMLFAFVEKVCKAVGAPMPAEIQIDCHANASASFRSGLWGFFTDELVLTIGLPLASGLTLREFAGVMAHELGHFSQPIAMRAIYIINTVNRWFACAIYAGSGKPLISENSELLRVHYAFTTIYFLSYFFVWITKGILWLLMTAGAAISSYMLRQMEFNADQYEAAVAGSDGFEATVKKLQTMNVATSMAFDSLSSAWSEGRLPDSLPVLIQNKVKDVTPEIKEHLKKKQLREQTSLFDSHPADQDRILAVRQMRAKGIVEGELSARVLFRDFAAVSRLATLDFYKEELGDEFNPASVRPVDDVLHKEKSDEEGAVILRNYFQAEITPVRSLQISETVVQAPHDLDAVQARIREDRALTLQDAPAYREALKTILDAESKLLNGQIALELIRYAVPVLAKDYDLTTADSAGAEKLIAESQQRIDQARPICDAYEALCGRRFVNVARLLASPVMMNSLPMGPKLSEEAADLLPMANFFGGIVPVLLELQDKACMMYAILDGVQGREENQNYMSRAEEAIRQTHAVLERVNGMLGDTVYPFDHARGIVTLRQFALKTVPSIDAPRRISEVTQESVKLLYDTHFRILSRLALIAQDMEGALGLPAFPAPSDTPTKGQLSRLRDLQRSGTVAAVPPPPRSVAAVPPPPLPTSSGATGTKRPESKTAIRF